LASAVSGAIAAATRRQHDPGQELDVIALAINSWPGAMPNFRVRGVVALDDLEPE